jgi:hypothetical protein
MFWFLKRNIICKTSIILESKMGFLSKISGIFKKKNKMSFAEKSLEEIDAELKNSDFQWIKGEQTGMIEKYAGIDEINGMKFLNFQGGGRINLEILQEFMDIFPSSPIHFDELNVPKPNPPAPSPTKKGSVNSIDYGKTVQVGVEESPIYKLLKKQKPNWVNVNISLKLNLPTKSLYNVLISSFEDADTEIANYVTEGVDIEDIKEAIAESIRTSFYESKKSSSTPQTKKQIQPIDDELTED